MRRVNRLFGFLFLLSFYGVATVVIVGCDSKTKESESTKEHNGRSIFASNYPIEFFAKQLLAPADADSNVVSSDFFSIVGPAVQTANPRDWNPDDDAIGQMQDSQLIFTVGAEYETWIQFVTLPEDRICELGRPLYKKYIDVKGEVHKHGPEGEEHAHTGIANYFWLDPDLAIAMVDEMEKSLNSLGSDSGEPEDDNRSARTEGLKSKLMELGAALDQLAKQSQGTVVFTSDPRYLYLTRRLRWKDVYFRWTDHGKEELPENAFEKLDQALSDDTPKWMIFPFEPGEQVRKELSKRNIDWIVVDSLDRDDGSENDFLSRFQANLAALSDAVAD